MASPLILQIKVRHPRLLAGAYLFELGIRFFRVATLSRLANKASTYFIVRWCISERIMEPGEAT